MITVITVARENLGLPGVDPIQLLLYKNTASFASYGQGWQTLPIDVEDWAAFTQGNQIHIDLAKTARKKWGALISLLAHEYGHTIEAAVAKRYTTSWFGEGFASWIAGRTVHALGWQDYSVTFERAKSELINSQPLPALNEMAWNWKALRHASNGHIKTYVLAFVAVDRLVNKGGLSATIEYLKSGQFEKSFPFSWAGFQSDFDKYLSDLQPPPTSDRVLIQRPDWKPGDHWTYNVKRPGDNSVLTQAVVREDSFGGETSYVVLAEDRELFYSKERLAQLGSKRNGQIITRRYGPSYDFSWPLTLGKRWRNTFRWQDLETDERQKTDYEMVVAEMENVTVPAGIFPSARIQGYDSTTARLMREYWYSPTTKWLVKSREYSPFKEEELTNFKIN